MKKLQAEILILAPEASGITISNYVKNHWLNFIKPDERKWKKFLEKDLSGKVKETKDGLQLLHYRNQSFVDVKRKLQIHPDDVKRPGIILISSYEDYKNFIENIYCNISYLFAVPELGWSKNAAEMEGYLISKELIKTVFKSLENLQVKFISALEHSQIVDSGNFEGVEVAKSFPHSSILNSPTEEELFSTYTSIHFELIKNLSLTLQGLIQGAHHDLNTIVSGLKENNIEEVKERLFNVFFSMQALEEPLDFKFTELGTQINTVTSLSSINEIVDPVRNLLQNAEYSDNQLSEESSKKFNYRVCIVEDDPLYRQILSEVFSTLFENVYPSGNELDAYDLDELTRSIKDAEVDFDIFILDLLYQKNSHWMSFNGLDIYDIIKKVYPDSAIRIVTSLPRDVISKVTEKMASENKLTEKIPMSHIFSKAKGEEVLRYSIIDRVDEIVRECVEAQRNQINVELPVNGVFAQNGVRNYIRRLMMHEPDRFNELVDHAKHLHEIYVKGELYKESTGWNKGQLPGSNTFKNSWKESTLIGHLPNIMTHRLLVLTEMDKVTANINMTLFKEKVIGLVGFKNFKGSDYLNTRLGFERENAVNEEDRIVEQIMLNNLFPHEREFLDDFSVYHEDQLVMEISKDLGEWFNNLIVSYEGSMGLYHLSNNEESFLLPYKNPDKNELAVDDLLVNKLTLAYLFEVLNLIKKYVGKKTADQFIRHAEELFDDIETKSIPQEIEDEILSFFKIIE